MNESIELSTADISEPMNHRYKTWYPFRPAFEQWLKNDYLESKNSKVVRDYCSRVGRLDKELFKPSTDEDWFLKLPAILMNCQGNAFRLLGVYQSFVCDEKKAIIEKRWDKKKTSCENKNGIGSLSSAFIAYTFFIHDLVAEEENITSFFKKNKVNKLTRRDVSSLNDFCKKLSTQTFSKEELQTVFKSRLLTQDRLWGTYKTFFPIRLANKVLHEFGNSDAANKWAKESISEIRLQKDEKKQNSRNSGT